MLDKEAARELVTESINSTYHVPGDELVVLDKNTIEKEYGWVFFYTSRRYLETGDISFMLAGNGPIVVERKDGAMTRLGTGLTVREYLREYEAQKHSSTSNS